MRDFRAVADRVEIEALRGEFVDALMCATTTASRRCSPQFGRLRLGRSELNYALYHDRYLRTPDGWKFAERAYEVRYVDTTPLSGSPPASEEAPG